MNYLQRAQHCVNATAKKLLTLMHKKQTNLCIAADVTRSAELLHLARSLAPEICLFKTHIDILEDFTPDVTAQLRTLADQHHFLIFEDRKFADIGNTVHHQFQGGIYHIADWADIINAHIIPGPGIIQGLKKSLRESRGLLLLAEMSSEGTLAKGSYANAAKQMAEENSDFVIGFICQKKISDHPGFIHLTPGIQFSAKGDSLGQHYRTPEAAISAGTDIIIVGRGILEAKDPCVTAALYRQAGWQAYVDRYC